LTESYNVAHPGLGCTVAYATANTYDSPTTVGQLKSIGGTNWEGVLAPSTGINSTAAEQVAVGLFKGGEYEFTVIYDAADATHIALEGYVGTTTTLYWLHTFSLPVGPSAPAATVGKMYKFPAYVSGFSTTGYEAEGIIEATIKLGVTGAVDIVAQSDS